MCPRQIPCKELPDVKRVLAEEPTNEDGLFNMGNPIHAIGGHI